MFLVVSYSPGCLLFVLICASISHVCTFLSLVYLLFPPLRETLQGEFLEVFNLFSGQFSDYFPGKDSGENPRKSIFSLLNSFQRPLKGPNKPVSFWICGPPCPGKKFHAEADVQIKHKEFRCPEAKN